MVEQLMSSHFITFYINDTFPSIFTEGSKGWDKINPYQSDNGVPVNIPIFVG
jgi:hypothetical protein